jgi:cytochrome bd-type quinol oxidase subunit 2
MSFSIASSIFSVMYLIIKFGLYVYLTILAFREKNRGAWIMAIGIVLFVAAVIVQTAVFPTLANRYKDHFMEIYTAIYSMSAVGEMLVLVGVLLTLLAARGRQQRIEQLETILNQRSHDTLS